LKVLSLLESVPKNLDYERMSEIKIANLCPLYQNLYDRTNISDPPQMNWAVVSSKLGSLNEKEMELMYVLILSYYYQENKTFLDKKKMTPYKGKLMDANKGVLYTITEFPIRLQQIIYEYIETIRS
jgi:hypothetical protein